MARALAVLALVCVGAALVGAALWPRTAIADEATQRAAELEQLRGRIQELRTTLDRDLGRADRERATLRNLEQTVARHADDLRAKERRLAENQRRLDGLQRQRTARVRDLEREREALAGQLRVAYATGRQDRLKLLLNQEDPSAVGRLLAYHDYFNRTRLARIERVAALVAEVNELEDSIVIEIAALELERDRQRSALAALESTRVERAVVVTAIERELRSGGQQLQRMEQDERSLVRLLESLTNLLADLPADLSNRPSFGTLRGRLGWPTRGSVIARFGQQREGEFRTRGLLISAPPGTEVHAVAYGRVAWAGWMPHYGNLIIIDHGEDYFSLYGHNRTMLRAVGEWVGASEVIAEVGDSGGQSRAALYFELRKGREPFNPQPWLVTR